MKKREDLPEVGFVAWYVGSGDSLTILSGQGGDSAELVIQVDINHLSAAEDDDEPYVPIIDQLVEILPKVGDRPYLAAFVLTHPDQDHCGGFEQLLDDVLIGELWATPRVFGEQKSDLCDDAIAFLNEADRRLEAMISGDDESGNRIRVVAPVEVFESEPFKALPSEAQSPVGSSTAMIDGVDTKGAFSATFHGPLDVGEDTDRNDTSLAMRVALASGACEQRVLFLGDVAHETLGVLLDHADDEGVEFDILVAPHHGSKRALFDDDGNEVSEVISGLTDNTAEDAWVIVSAPPIPASDTDGADPPHRVAWEKYAEIFGKDNQVCTGQHGSEDDPDPVVFGTGDDNCGYLKPSTAAALAASSLIGTAAEVRPRPRPTERRGYGSPG